MTENNYELDGVLVELLNSEGLHREFKITIPSLLINQRVSEVISKEAATFKMAGFREGKVPMALVKRQIGQEVLKKELGIGIDSSIKKVIQHSNLVPAMSPEVHLDSFNNDGVSIEVENDIVFRLSFDALPEMPKIDYDAISLNVDKIKVSDSDLEKAKKDIMKKLKNLREAPSDYRAASGDTVVVKSEGKIDGVDFALARYKSFELEIGAGDVIKGFDDHLLGMAVGEEKEFSLNLPPNYPEKPGALVDFKVSILEILTSDSEEKWDDHLAKKLGFEKVEDLDKILRDRISLEFTVMERFQSKKELFDYIDKNYDLEIPPKMLQADVNSVLEEMKKNTPEDKHSDLTVMQQDALLVSKRRVKIGLIIADISRNNNIRVSEDDFKKIIELQVNQFPDKKKEIVEFYSKVENMRMIEAPLLEEKTVDFILSKIKINYSDAISIDDFNKKHNFTKEHESIKLMK